MKSMRAIPALLAALLLTCGVYAAQAQMTVALTFDDGPCSRSTAYLLRGLRSRGVRATFFLSGYRVDECPDEVRAIAAQGHELAVHGQTHSYFRGMTAEQLRGEIDRTAQSIRALTGVQPTLVRPPGGLLDDGVRRYCRDAGCAVILWSVDPEDWDAARRGGVADRVLAKVADGDIVLLHDITVQNADQAFAVIDRLRDRGCRFCTVSELAALRGQTLTPGEAYFRFRGKKEEA